MTMYLSCAETAKQICKALGEAFQRLQLSSDAQYAVSEHVENICLVLIMIGAVGVYALSCWGLV